MVNETYGADSIQILEGLEAVRKRPGMYIGSTDSRGLHHLVWEIVDNAIDEALAGYAKNISVTIKEDNSICVVDDGRGVPVGLHKSGLNALDVVFTVLHAGGKFGQEGGYKVAGGLHGVGASVVNALSEWMIVEAYRDGKIYYQKYENGGKNFGKVQVIGETKKTGTKVWFKPDHTIFSTTLFLYQTLEERLRESAFLNKGLTINLIDERSKQKTNFNYQHGIKEFVAFLTENKTPLHDVCYFEGHQNEIDVEVSLLYTKTYTENILSFVNNVLTKDAGTHEVGFKTALTRIFNEFGRKLNILKEKDASLEGTDVREGLTAVISVKIPENILEFEGQTKNKLGTPIAKSTVENITYEKLMYFFAENPNITQMLIQKATQARNARDAARQARDTARLIKTKTKMETSLSGKLSPASSKNSEINELYLVEGDSAGGTAKQGRDRKYQAILPLRGKVLNSEKARIEEVLKNEEFNTLIQTIGAGLGQDFDIKKSNYKKIIIMTDADTDGAHIQILLLTFFFRYMRKLVENGCIYIAMPPLYKISKNGKKPEIRYAWSEEEREKITKEFKSYDIQRYKGLGEMNAIQLWETTMNPETRTLIQVRIDDLADAEQRVSILMGDDVDPRREWIEANVVFEDNDDFKVKELAHEENY